jgi:endonuclease YncB( thermonuclease family)
VLGIAALLAAFAYFKARDRKLPPVITGQAAAADGDTISIGGTRIRLQGTDAPEWEQTCDDAKVRHGHAERKRRVSWERSSRALP